VKYILKIKFQDKVPNYPINAKWEPGNILCIPCKVEPTQAQKQTILRMYLSQNTSLVKPYILEAV
jgi:hypothetical protein